MITAKQAAERAKAYLVDLLGLPGHMIMLEEVELDENGNIWHITLSYPSQTSQTFGTLDREYKAFRVGASDGEILSMKIRKFD